MNVNTVCRDDGTVFGAIASKDTGSFYEFLL
jgi:hypothetical protein